jgi:hypothetical protein
MKRLFADRSGETKTSLLSTSLLWFLLFGVFLFNTQLNRNYVQRDFVDHATSIAADTAAKTLCADPADFGGSPVGDATGPRLQAIRSSVDKVLSLVSDDAGACKLTLLTADKRPLTRAQPDTDIAVELKCEFPCTLPFAAQIMCSGSPRRVRLEATQITRPMGCDVR